MTLGDSVEARISRWLRDEAPGDLPTRVLDATFERTRALPQEPRWGRVNILRRRAPLLLAAALAVSASAVGLFATGALRTTDVKQPSLLAEIRDAGRIRIVVRRDHPQVTIGNQPPTGFDLDVAHELASHLGVRADTTSVDPAELLTATPPTEWDAELPSIAAWEIDGFSYLMSSAYYRWPHYLVVASDSPAAGIADVADGPICAVDRDGGAAWLRGEYGSSPSAAITQNVVIKASDDECIAALTSGNAVAAVTAHLSAADLQVRADIRSIGGPEPEPRPVIVRLNQGQGRDPEALVHAIDDALAAMRADGTLTRLSQNRFGGLDLTTP